MNEVVLLGIESHEDAEGALDWLRGIGTGAATGAATGAVAGPWGALVGGVVGAGLGALQTHQQQQQQQHARRPPPRRPAPPPRRPAPDRTRPTQAPSRPSSAPAPVPSPAPGGSTSAAAQLQALIPALTALVQQLSSQRGSTSAESTASAPPQELDVFEDWRTFGAPESRPDDEPDPGRGEVDTASADQQRDTAEDASAQGSRAPDHPLHDLFLAVQQIAAVAPSEAALDLDHHGHSFAHQRRPARSSEAAEGVAWPWPAALPATVSDLEQREGGSDDQ